MAEKKNNPAGVIILIIIILVALFFIVKQALPGRTSDPVTLPPEMDGPVLDFDDMPSEDWDDWPDD